MKWNAIFKTLPDALCLHMSYRTLTQLEILSWKSLLDPVDA